MKKIIVTGATGMIGANLVRVALANECSVLCLVRKNSQKLENIPTDPRVKILFADANEYANLMIDEKYDTFFHFAWEKTYGDSRDDVFAQLKNVEYSMDAIRLAHRSGCSSFIGAGSQAEYGPVSAPLSVHTPINPQSGYGIAKYTVGRLGGLLAKSLGLRFNWIRVLSIYGCMDNPYTLIMYAVREMKKGNSPELTKCEQIWDYLNESDAAKAFFAVGEKGVDQKIYILGSGSGRELRSYIEDIKSLIGFGSDIMYGKKEYQINQPMFLVADTTELRNDTQWKPEIDFFDGISLLLSNYNC